MIIRPRATFVSCQLKHNRHTAECHTTIQRIAILLYSQNPIATILFLRMSPTLGDNSQTAILPNCHTAMQPNARLWTALGLHSDTPAMRGRDLIILAHLWQSRAKAESSAAGAEASEEDEP